MYHTYNRVSGEEREKTTKKFRVMKLILKKNVMEKGKSTKPKI